MKNHRLFNFIVAVVLLVLVVITVREAAATTEVVASESVSAMDCASLPSRYSIHKEYVDGTGWVTSTEDSPTGVDGGLIQLLSDYRTCSQ